MVRTLLVFALLFALPLYGENQKALKFTEQWAVDLLYDATEVVDQLCRQNEIPYFCLSGTILGSHRDGGLIRWDGDVDIGMLEEDLQRFLTLEKELNRQGYEISPSIWDGVLWGYYVYSNKAKPSAHGKKYPAVELCPMKKIGSKVHYAVEEARVKWKNEYYTLKQWENITDIPFGHLTLRGLTGSDADSYCTRAYGDDWSKTAVVWWDHDKDQMIKQPRVRLDEHLHAKRSPK